MKYDNKECNRFVRDMKKAGFDPYHYHGRSFWEGPAVSVDDDHIAVAATRVKCQRDSLGKGYVVYPRASGKLIEE